MTHLFAQVADQQLPQDVVEVDLGRPLHGAEGEQRLQWLRAGGGGAALQPVVVHRLVGGAQHQRVLEEHGQRVDVDVEGQHDAAGEEGVRLAVVAGEQRQPHLHAGLAARQPQRLQQVALLAVGAAGGPHVLHALGQHHRRAEGELGGGRGWMRRRKSRGAVVGSSMDSAENGVDSPASCCWPASPSLVPAALSGPSAA